MIRLEGRGTINRTISARDSVVEHLGSPDEADELLCSMEVEHGAEAFSFGRQHVSG